MICCLNPQCRKPQNLNDAKVCHSCGSALVSLRGRYRAIQPLGQGGFGRTYLASDEDRLGARCVIKQFSPQVQGTKSLEKAVQLFNQEAVRLNELGEHPQIPTLLAYFEQDKYLYLVQQFIEGQNLLQLMKQEGAFGERKIRDVLSDILPVLRFVHSRQVIHRDITPTNILRRQNDDRLMLIDFGVAKQVDEESGAEPGTRIGTEGYSPMEQFRGGRAYPASDLYSLGATCLHLMTETKPDLLYDPLNGQWIWREYLVKHGIIVSQQLAGILDRMLKDLVGERYQSADEVMRDLNADSFLPSSPLPKLPLSPPLSKPPLSKPPDSVPPASSSGGRSSERRAQSGNPVFRSPTSPSSASQSSASRSPASRPPEQPTRITGSSGSPTGSRRCLHTLTGHSSWVMGVAVSPDGNVIASSSLDDTVKIWNLHAGELTFTLVGHTRAVNAIAITPDGTTAISGSDDYSIRLWQLANGTLMRTLTGHSRDVNALAISPDGKILVSGGEDRTIRLWHLPSGAPLHTLLGMAGMIRSIATSSDGQLLASGGLDHKVRVWNLQTGTPLRVLSGHFNSIQAVAISPDNKILASGSKDKTIKVWNAQTGELLHTLTGHSRDVNAIAISPNSKILVSGSSDATLKLWNLHSGSLLDTLTGHADTINAVAITTDGRLVITSSSDNTVKVWQMMY
jgi:serine/threonine protein kinase